MQRDCLSQDSEHDDMLPILLTLIRVRIHVSSWECVIEYHGYFKAEVIMSCFEYFGRISWSWARSTLRRIEGFFFKTWS